MRVEFTRTLGRFAIREGIVKGPMIGATTEGYIDYLKDDVRMRGTFVPFYGLNNMFGQIPLFGIFLGGGNNEGLVGLTFEVVGSPSSPTLRVNPIFRGGARPVAQILRVPHGGYADAECLRSDPLSRRGSCQLHSVVATTETNQSNLTGCCERLTLTVTLKARAKRSLEGRRPGWCHKGACGEASGRSSFEARAKERGAPQDDGSNSSAARIMPASTARGAFYRARA